MKRCIWISLVALALFGGAAGCSSGPDDGPDAVVRQFYDHLNDGAYDRALALYSAEAKAALVDPEAADSRELFAEWAQIETKEGKVDEVRVIDQSAEESSATIEFEVVYSDGSRASRKVELTRVDGGWKLGLIG